MKVRSLRACGAVAAAVSLALLTSACGAGSTHSPAAADDGKPVTLTYWTWTGGAEAAAAAFNKTHTDIQVRFSQIPGGADGYSKISNAIKAGDAPDVATVEYSMVPEFASQGYLEDLIASFGELVEESFPAGVRDLVTFGGKTWSVPFDATPQVYFYRKDLFEKYGVTVPKTWDEYRTAAERIKADDPAARMGSFPADAPLQAALSWQAGAKWFRIVDGAWKPEINDAPSQKVAAFWQGMRDDDLVFDYGAGTPEESKSKADGTTVSILGAPHPPLGHPGQRHVRRHELRRDQGQQARRGRRRVHQVGDHGPGLDGGPDRRAEEPEQCPAREPGHGGGGREGLRHLLLRRPGPLRADRSAGRDDRPRLDLGPGARSAPTSRRARPGTAWPADW
ncbi:ABC transporter substrate-binding protein [Streptomyces sp. NPDC005533]|uniref:ABC transporter substrate-binding protein n=1 Tax=Streptomyces sp. NPDC005533 TaxID=3364723 RepID=UPI0036CC6D85